MFELVLLIVAIFTVWYLLSSLKGSLTLASYGEEMRTGSRERILEANVRVGRKAREDSHYKTDATVGAQLLALDEE